MPLDAPVTIATLPASFCAMMPSGTCELMYSSVQMYGGAEKIQDCLPAGTEVYR